MIIKEAKIKMESTIQNLDSVGLADGDPDINTNVNIDADPGG